MARHEGEDQRLLHRDGQIHTQELLAQQLGRDVGEGGAMQLQQGAMFIGVVENVHQFLATLPELRVLQVPRPQSLLLTEETLSRRPLLELEVAPPLLLAPLDLPPLEENASLQDVGVVSALQRQQPLFEGPIHKVQTPDDVQPGQYKNEERLHESLQEDPLELVSPRHAVRSEVRRQRSVFPVEILVEPHPELGLIHNGIGAAA